MIAYPDIDPVLFAIGPLKVRWYGTMYVLAMGLAWWLASVRARRPDNTWNPQQVGDAIFYGAVGVIVGGRLGYILFYQFERFVSDPMLLFRTWEGGMSFHGGLLGVILAVWLLARRYKKSLFEVTDFMAPVIPLGLGLGRIGNFINNELWGKPTDVPWAIVPPGATQGLHPSQLYEAFLEGVVLFLILWIFSARPRPVMAVSGLFLAGYGLFRFTVEFVRMPDRAIGYIAFDWLTMGQILSLPMIIIGVIMMILAYKKQAGSKSL